MKVIEAINSRQSIRKYLGKEVSKEILHDLIDAARLAPSGCNAQAWAYKILSNEKDIVDLKNNNVFPQDFVYTAPAIIFCCFDSSVFKNESNAEDNASFGTEAKLRAVRDVSIASSYLMLRAEELGLGTCYIGLLDKVKAKAALEIPENMEVLFAISVGYPNESPARKPRKAINEIIID